MNANLFRDVDALGLRALGTPEALAELARRRQGGDRLRTTWQRQRRATAHLDPETRAAVRADLEARRRRAMIRAVNVATDEPTPDGPFGNTG